MLSNAHNALLEELTARYRGALGADEATYLGHVRRVLGFYASLRGAPLDERDIVAAFFHDLGIWTDRTNDYLPPSIEAARAYLEETGRAGDADLVTAMIDNHHKLRAYAGPHEERVEPFRRADLVDFSFGLYSAGLPRQELRAAFTEIPPGAFRRFLIGLAGKWLLKYPTRPFPIFRL
ncbi:MAG: phosphohydrolase [Chrysiogenetes bacterium]|nr:phosphohydrolase [Chrysiogenetes bacterium]